MVETEDTHAPLPGRDGGSSSGQGAIIPLEPVDAAWGSLAGVDEEPPKRGILNIDKPAGKTSHDVVQAVRRASGVRRVGHAGTLDPMATGVLVVCIGSATRVIDALQAGVKTYRAGVRLGITTTTDDAEGKVVGIHDTASIDRARVERALGQLRGEILQTPPMYAAVHHEGRRLYELARRGIEVERVPRPVTVHRLTLTAWEPPELTLELDVSKGTYVRALARDLGAALGVGAHLTALERTAVGRFTLAEAESLPRVIEAFADGWWPQLLYALDTALLDLPALIVDAARAVAIRRGQQLDGPAPRDQGQHLARAYDADGAFVGLVRWDDVTARWQPDRVFPPG